MMKFVLKIKNPVEGEKIFKKKKKARSIAINLYSNTTIS